MLSSLRITNIAIIKETAIDFNNGFNVLTGETGAGKSIIIDAINAVLGERTSRELIRTGCDYAEVSAYFTDINSTVKSQIVDLGLTNEEDSSLLIYRKLFSDGKNVCRINGQNATVSMLKSLGQTLVNIHGQLDNQNLLNEELHYTYIDAYASNESIRDNYRQAYSEFREAEKQYNDFVIDESEKAKRIDILSFQIDEIRYADINPGEYDSLINKRNVLQNFESLYELVNGANDILNGDGDASGAEQMLNTAAGFLNKASDIDNTLKPLYDSLSDISYNLSDISSELSRFIYSLNVNPNELNSIEERLDTISKIIKKYGEDEESVLTYLENIEKELENLNYSDELREKYRQIKEEKFETLKEKGKILTDSRFSAGASFENAVAGELVFLEMPSIIFKCVREESDYSENGCDNIYFLISANAGEEPKALSKIASGGELSRIMLAIKNVLSDKDSIQTLIFDEIDAGVSGKTAHKIGIKLKEVSSERQVLCVTHLAQIAAFADSHYLISKSETDNQTYTKVENLDAEGRTDELARIIGGMYITDASRAAAKELIEKTKSNT